MKQYVLMSVAAVLILSCSSDAAMPIRVSVAPWFGHSYGETEYIMDLRGWLPDENGDPIYDASGDMVIARVKSQLEFPLDFAMAGVTARLALGDDPDFIWFEGGIYTSLNDPGGIMTDADWQGVTGYVPFTMYSYTESEAQGSAIRMEIEGGIRVLSPGKMTIHAVAGYRYQKIEQDVIGYEGWFIPFDETNLVFSDQTFAQSGTGLAGRYRVTYKQPQVGALTSLILSPNLSASLKTVYTPVWFDDFDDHVLRFKTSVADGTGNGFIGSLRVRYEFGNGGPGQPFLGANVDYVSIATTGSQTQSWYGDDPASEDVDDTGVSIPNIPHEVNSTQYNIGLRVGLSF